MEAVKQHINTLGSKLRLLLKNYELLKKENQTLKHLIKELKENDAARVKQIDELKQKLGILQASTGKMNEEERKEFEGRINQYLKEIDKVIALLSQ
jgi:chromosome segregation ATPase